MRSARHRGRRIIFLAIAALVALFVVLTAVLFVWPATNAPRRSDAIVVLGGSGPRIQKGLALARAGYAPYLVLSGYDRATCPSPPSGVKVICFDPHPDTTQGEAQGRGDVCPRVRLAPDHRGLGRTSDHKGPHQVRPLLHRADALRPRQPGRSGRVDLQRRLRVGGLGQGGDAPTRVLTRQSCDGSGDSALTGVDDLSPENLNTPKILVFCMPLTGRPGGFGSSSVVFFQVAAAIALLGGPSMAPRMAPETP